MVEKMMKPMFRAININENARRIDVDDKIPLSNYYRIASNLIKQAAIYREEKNLIDLYIILLRFSSLLSETIPFHVDYKVLFPEKRTAFKKKLWNVITELESLKPEVHRLVDELNQELMLQFDLQTRSTETSDEPTVREIVSIHSGIDKLYQTPRFGTPQSSRKNGELSQSDISNVHVGRQFDKLSIKLPPPKEETLSRHSVLGHNRFQAQCLPLSGMKIHYPSNSVLTLAEVSRSNHDEKSRIERSKIESVLSLDDGRWIVPVNENYISSIEPIQSDYLPNNLRQPSPPPVLAQVHNALPLSPSKVANPRPGPAKTLPEGIPDSKTYHHIHVSVRMMEDFMRLAQANTSNNLETCGILAGLLKNRMFCVTTLIIPKQESTSDSCQTLNEEEIFDVQDKLSLFPLGWIHTHPSQSCFMSSVDLHTHYSYQVMLPEAIAIVMAPKDDIRTHGIFHLSDPGGISLIRNCQQRGFHPHEEPPDGSPIYEHCSHVYMNPNLKCDVMDLRN